MATHSSTLAWRIPWIGEPGGLQPVGKGLPTVHRLRVGHDESNLARMHANGKRPSYYRLCAPCHPS